VISSSHRVKVKVRIRVRVVG